MYVIRDSPTIAVVERYIAHQCNVKSRNNGYFLVKFANLDDWNEILYFEPHMMNNKPIIVKVWSPKFDFNKEVLQSVPIWVKYPNLPLN